MKRFLQFMIFALVALIVGQGRAANLTKEQFLGKAGGIDASTATAMAENLTNADWYEVDSAFLLDAFHATLEAHGRFAWGKTVPEDIYLQYVVPLRVEDEPLQPFRRKLLEEIGPRLDSLHSLARAALEVNLYLGERVGFKSTDRRDQGPLTTLSSGFGRCEELMILAVDAMRSVGIPARGVWVPAWSVSDNNHVWLEVYTEDGWKYLGPAEPATRLNKAWFDKAVQRAPIVLTMGRSSRKTDSGGKGAGSAYSLNVTGNYMSPARLTVEMPENWGETDRLWLAVFNFGALRPLVELSPKEGIATLEIGNGDFVLMGVHAGRLFFQTFTAQLHRETRLRLDVSQKLPLDFTLTYPWPAVSGQKEPELLAADRIEQAHALRRERNAKRDWVKALHGRIVTEGGAHSGELFKTLQRSAGNEQTVLNAVLAVPPEQRDKAIYIVSLLSAKDLREVGPVVLSRWLQRTPAGQYAGDDELKALLLDPQIGYEYPGTGLPSGYATDPLSFSSLEQLRDAVARYSSLVDTSLVERPLPPVTVDHMLADGVSIGAANAALWWTDRLRRSGVPARREPFSEWLEFYHAGKWLPLFPCQPGKLGDRDALPGVREHFEKPATVTLRWKEAAAAPKWKSDFLLLPIEKNGLPDYRKDTPKETREENNATVVTLVAGQYLFTSGRRNGRGDAAVQVRTITLGNGEVRSITLDPKPPPEPPADCRTLHLRELDWKAETAAGKHLLVILGDNEPSTRISDQIGDMEADGVRVDFVGEMDRLSASDRDKLGLKGRDAAEAPYVYFFDENGMLLFAQSGYDLNLPARARNTLR